MSAPTFEYYMPKTMEEACSLLSEHKAEAKIIAGGTDLLAKIKHREVLPRYLINIRGIPGQDYTIYDERDGLRIGAQATIDSIATSLLIREKFGILGQAASELGSATIRGMATIGGNVCNAAPSAEMATPLIVLGARVKITGADGERTVPIENFFTGPGQTILKPDEVVTEFQVPNLPPRTGGVYIKHAVRKAMDIAVVGVAVIITMDEDILSNVKIALGAVAPTPVRAKKAENVLAGRKMDEELIEKAAQAASDESSPIDDIRSSAEYRRKMVKVLVAKAIKLVWNRVG